MAVTCAGKTRPKRASRGARCSVGHAAASRTAWTTILLSFSLISLSRTTFTNTQSHSFAHDLMYMYNAIQDALDDVRASVMPEQTPILTPAQLASLRSSVARQGRALGSLERLLADICVPKDAKSAAALRSFVALQDAFQCNGAWRLWCGADGGRMTHA